MRSLVLATVAAVASLSTYSAPSSAQIVTIDPAEITQTINTLHQLQQEYQAVMGVFGSLLRAVDPNSIATSLIGSQPLPGALQISGMLSGSGNFGNLSEVANQFLSANTAYTPRSTGADDFNASFLQRNSNTLAGVQAMIQQSIQSIQTHIAGLIDIQGELSTVKTEADVSAINGRLTAEQANLSAQGVQAQSLQTMLQAQQAQYQLQEMQKRRQSADALLQSVTGGVPGSGASTPTTTTTVPTFTAGG
jgi:Type IV secretion system proteins